MNNFGVLVRNKYGKWDIYKWNLTENQADAIVIQFAEQNEVAMVFQDCESLLPKNDA